MAGHPSESLAPIVLEVAKGEDANYSVLSTGEQLYVALAANRIDLLDKAGVTIAGALDRLGPDWVQAFVERWRFAYDPRKVT